ncbi:MAG: hypothetical protein LC749_18920 [Actinobacteria bacterium]|nr:hypothetical protein [Actinomycetota bacterium]
MKITVRVQVGTAEEQGAEQFSEVFVLEREALTEASVGLSLTEAHTLLASIQEAMVCAQATAAVAEQTCCAPSTRQRTLRWGQLCLVRCCRSCLSCQEVRWRGGP